MGTVYPGALDSITRPDPGATLAASNHAQRHDDESDAIEAIEAYVGVTGSTDPTSITARVDDLEGAIGFTGDADDVAFTPTGTIAATNVQAAIAEVNTEKVGIATTTTAGFGFAVDEDDMASNSATKFPVQQSVKAYVDTHIADATAAHQASAVSFDNTASGLTGDTVQEAIDELDASIAAGGIPGTIGDAAYDLITFSAADTPIRHAKGANYTVLGITGAGVLAYLVPRAIPATVNAQVGTTYTLALTDTWVTLDNAAAIALTVPTNASVPFPVGTMIDVAQIGAGQVTVGGGGGVTVSTSSTLKLRTQFSPATLIKTGTDAWLLTGDLEPPGQTIVSVAGTTYGFTLPDAWKLVASASASPTTFTVPANASIAFPIGTHIDLVQLGTGQLTIAITSDNLRYTPTAKLRAQFSAAGLVKTSASDWLLTGDLAAT